MRIAVVVEQVWDPVSVELDAVTGAIDASRVAPIAGPGSLEAIELGLQLGEVVAYGMGPQGVESVLRRCVAMGAGSAVRVATSASHASPDELARALAQALEGEEFGLVLAPARSGDQSASLLGPLLAGLLDLPQATGVDDLRIDAAAGEALVRRRLDRGQREQLALPLPAVIAVEPGLVAPRDASPAALLESQQAVIRLVEAETPAGSGLVFLGRQPPRPPPPWLPAPDASQPAEARISLVIGATPEGRQRSMVRGAPDELAARIVDLLEETGSL